MPVGERLKAGYFQDTKREAKGPFQYMAGNEASCKILGVDEAKIFPHNFRHLFARAFTALQETL